MLQGVGSSGVGVCKGANVLVLRSLRGTLGFERLSAWGVLARGSAPVIILWVEVCCLGLGGGLLSLLAYLGWGRCGLRGLGSNGFGVEGESGVLARGSVPVLVLLVGVCLPGLGNGLLSLSAYLGLG